MAFPHWKPLLLWQCCSCICCRPPCHAATWGTWLLIGICFINFINFISFFAMLSLNNPLITIWFWFLGHNNPRVCRVWGIPRQHFWSSYPGGRRWLPSCSWGCWIPARWWGPIRDPSTSQSWCYPLAFSGFWTSGVTRQWRCTFDLWTKTQFRASAEAVCSP